MPMRIPVAGWGGVRGRKVQLPLLLVGFPEAGELLRGNRQLAFGLMHYSFSYVLAEFCESFHKLCDIFTQLLCEPLFIEMSDRNLIIIT